MADKEMKKNIKVTALKVFILTILCLQFSSVAQSCPTLCDPMNRSTPGLPVHHQLLESTQTHSHRVCAYMLANQPLKRSSVSNISRSEACSGGLWTYCSAER